MPNGRRGPLQSAIAARCASAVSASAPAAPQSASSTTFPPASSTTAAPAAAAIAATAKRRFPATHLAATTRLHKAPGNAGSDRAGGLAVMPAG